MKFIKQDVRMNRPEILGTRLKLLSTGGFLFQGGLSSPLKTFQGIKSVPLRLPKVLWILVTSAKYLHTSPRLEFG